MRERQVIHLNVADFAVAVERLVDHRLKTRPVLIAPQGTSRTVVFDHSEEAFQAGVRKNMALQRAARLCPEAIVLAPHIDRYERAMVELFKKALPYSPLVEQTDTQGHIFLDITGTSRLHGPPQDVGMRLRKTIEKEIGLVPIWTLANNKLLAKVASRVVKPIGEHILHNIEGETFLKEIPLHLIPGIETDDVRRFSELNLHIAGEVTQLSRQQLMVLFGQKAGLIHDVIRGVDTSPVLAAGQKNPVVTFDHTFGDDTNDAQIVDSTLFNIIEKVGLELRKSYLAAQKMVLYLDYTDGIRTVRQMRLTPATMNTFNLYDGACALLEKAWTRRVRLRYIKVVCNNLIFPPACQMDLFDKDFKEQTQRTQLVGALDTIRGRFGNGAILVGRSLTPSSPSPRPSPPIYNNYKQV